MPMVVHHKDGNPRNNDPSNLEFVSMKRNESEAADNSAHMYIAAQGDANHYVIMQGKRWIAHVQMNGEFTIPQQMNMLCGWIHGAK